MEVSLGFKKSHMNKKYCILIPSYNAKEVDVLKTFTGIPNEADILIIDDGSKFSFAEEFKKILSEKPNAKVLRLRENVGIEAALNKGLNEIVNHFDYIARIDIGDYSTPTRFDKQLSVLESNPSLVLVGGWARFVEPNGKELFISKLPTSDKKIRKLMYINNMFIHPCVMMRSSALLKSGGYRDKYISCEDYDLFFRLLKQGACCNIPEVLINYEVNFGSISSVKRKTQVLNRIRIILENFSFHRHGIYPYYGLVRNTLMLAFSRNFTNWLRTMIRK